ncbi:MAG TPA: hemolysin family protein [Nitriliruptorales bacterium]|nr:hemolysin family protein [Nitriliruptorales bacterium]
MSLPAGLLVVTLLVLATAFFVAAEFAIVTARRPVVEELADDGSRSARAALHAMRNLSFVLSGAQLGITITTLVLGYLAEDAFAAVLRPVIELVGLPERSALGVSLTAALVLSTVLSMVVGELAPKNLAIARPESTALTVALPLRVYSFVFGPAIRLFDASANAITRRFGAEPQHELLGGYDAEELAMIIEASSEEGQLDEEKAQLLLRAVELGERRVSEVMVPRPDVAWLQADQPLAALREASRRTGHSRFPVYGSDEDDVVGTVHIKDLLDVPAERAPTATIADIVYEALVVPESRTLRQLLGDLRQRHRTFAVVVDEYGGVAGIVTLEDVLEELVGDIEDEFDPASQLLRRVGTGRYLVPGRLRVDRLEQVLGTEVGEGDFETVAGFVIERLGHIPAPGECVDHDGWRLVVQRVEGNRVTEVLLERVPGPAGADGVAPGDTRGAEPS